MLNAETLRAEQIDAVRRMHDGLKLVLRDLHRLPKAVSRARAAMPPPQDPMSFDAVLSSRTRALRHARRAAGGLEASDDTVPQPVLADVLELTAELRDGLASARNLDDLSEMLAEAPDGPAHHAISVVEGYVRALGTEADHLFTQAVAAAQQDPFPGADDMTDTSRPAAGSTTPDLTAEAVRDLSELLAKTLGTPSALPPSSARGTGRRFDAVADQMSASLDAFGLPHDGVQLPPVESGEVVRSQLIEGLLRNFAWRDEDGTRTYYRSAPQVVVRETEADMRLLRGSALVNANLLRAEADGVLAIMDRLPDMLRFAPSQPLRSSNDRARVRTMLDQLVATSSDPLGLNTQRGTFQFRRLSAALIDILLRGEVIDETARDGLQTRLAAGDPAAVWRDLKDWSGTIVDNLRVKTSAVREEEVKAELVGLALLMIDICHRASNPRAEKGLGVAASRLEELLGAADGSAVVLEDDLSRFGTTLAEQEVQFLDGEGSSRVSLAQFIAWVRATCEPFVGGENEAASLSVDELKILSAELGALRDCAEQFVAAAGMPTGFGGVRRQFDELKRYLAEARTQARLLAGDGSETRSNSSAHDTARDIKE